MNRETLRGTCLCQTLIVLTRYLIWYEVVNKWYTSVTEKPLIGSSNHFQCSSTPSCKTMLWSKKQQFLRRSSSHTNNLLLHFHVSPPSSHPKSCISAIEHKGFSPNLNKRLNRTHKGTSPNLNQVEPPPTLNEPLTHYTTTRLCQLTFSNIIYLVATS